MDGLDFAKTPPQREPGTQLFPESEVIEIIQYVWCFRTAAFAFILLLIRSQINPFWGFFPETLPQNVDCLDGKPRVHN